MRVLVNNVEEHGYRVATTGISLSYGGCADVKKRAEKLAPRQGGHNKFLESIILWIDVTGPRYWWQQADTYRLSTKQSESTMHTLLKRPLEQKDFVEPIPEVWLNELNMKLKAKEFSTLKAWLPEGFLQRRIWCMSYKTLQNIYLQRSLHKLEEWEMFLTQILSRIDYPEYITSAVKASQGSLSSDLETPIDTHNSDTSHE